MRDAGEQSEAEGAAPTMGAASLVANAVALFEAVDLPVVGTDTESVVTYWNTGAADLFGWSAEEAEGRHFGELLGAAYADSAVAALFDPETAKRSGQLPIQRIDGSTVVVRSTSNAVRDPSGKVIGLIVLFSEVLLDSTETETAGTALLADGATASPVAPITLASQEHSADRISAVMATDSLLIGEGLAALFAAGSDVSVVGRARGHLELVTMCRALAPQVAIISIRSADDSSMVSVTAARRLRAERPDMGIVLISDCGSGFALELLRDGSSRLAYLLDDRLPSIDTVLGAVRDVVAGQSSIDPSIVDFLVKHHRVSIDDLTHRESDVLELMAEGLSNRAIAEQLNVSVKSIEKCITAIFRNLDLTDQSRVDRRVTATLNYQRSKSTGLQYGLVRSAADDVDAHFASRGPDSAAS
jgi:PAS domain S-box-containing protein